MFISRRAAFRAAFVLLPVLGITWALGFLVLVNSGVAGVTEWLFFSFNTLQVSCPKQKLKYSMLGVFVFMTGSDIFHTLLFIQ